MNLFFAILFVCSQGECAFAAPVPHTYTSQDECEAVIAQGVAQFKAQKLQAVGACVPLELKEV